MERISGSKTQQSSPVSSSTAIAEEPVVTSKETKESCKEVKSHAGAEKQNAVSRQSENNLTAMLNKERIAESPRAFIKKENVDALAAALNSKNGGAEGVKEELARTFINNGPGQHAKIAETMRQFASAGPCSNGKAYQALKQEVRDWTKFDPSGMTQPAQRNLFKEVANLRGPGSERVKADVASMIQQNIDATEKSPVNGHRAYAGMYTGELRKMLQSDAPGILRTLVNEPGMRKEVSGMIDNLLNHKEGRKAIGEMVADMVGSTTKLLLRSPHENRYAAKALASFMDQVKEGIERNAKTREEMIEKGADLVGNMLSAAELLTLGAGKPFFDAADRVIDFQKDAELASVEEAKRKLCSTLDDIVDATFKSVTDPHGNLAAGDGDRIKVENYFYALEVYHQEYRARL